MSAYVADPDYAHSVLLNPANLVHAGNMYVAADYEHFSRGVNELFLPSVQPGSLANGNLTSWNFSLTAPLGMVGVGAAFDGFELGGWRTTVSAAGVGVQLPLGFSAGVSGKYITVSAPRLIPAVTAETITLETNTLSRFTFDAGVMNKSVLADNTFFRAILSLAADFSNVLAAAKWNPQGTYPAGENLNVNFPQTFSLGVAYTFASNYRLSDFELFRATVAADYEHVLSNSSPIDEFISQGDQYRFGLETTALGVLAVRIGYTLKSPQYNYYDSFNNLELSRMGSGFSYGFSLRFPVKLVLPDVPIISMELSYAKNPEWSSPMYHDMFGLVCELYF